MFTFIKKIFIGLLSACTVVSFGESLAFSNFEGRLKCISLSNRPCQTRPTIVDISLNETLFYSFSVSINKCSGNCNTIDNPYP